MAGRKHLIAKLIKGNHVYETSLHNIMGNNEIGLPKDSDNFRLSTRLFPTRRK